MKEESPTWQGIPDHTKEFVVGLLDLKSRFSLQLCSKTDHEIVLNAPMYLNQLYFEVKNVDGACTSLQGSLVAMNQDRLIQTKTNVVDNFIEVFKMKRSMVNELIIHCVYFSLEETNSPLDQLMTKLKALGPDFKLRAKKICLYINCPTDQYYGDFLQMMDPSLLEAFHMQGSISDPAFDRMVTTDAWKNCKHLQTHLLRSHVLDSVLHMNKIEACVVLLAELEVDRAIKRFISREDIKRGYGFQLKHLMDLRAHAIPSLNVPPPPPPVLAEGEVYEEFAFRPPFAHKYHFKTADKDLVFIVKLETQKTTGFACSVNDAERDFISFNNAPSYDPNIRIMRRRKQLYPGYPDDYYQYGPRFNHEVNDGPGPAFRIPQARNIPAP